MSDVGEWLESLGLSDHARTFADNDVDLDVLPHLTDQDLKDLGLSLGHRRKLLAAISALSKTKETLSSTAGPDGIKPPDHADAERRQLTVMFCDLVGSTELSQRLDPEDLREVMRRYQDAVSGAVIRYEGYVAKFLGDGVLAYFGWPQAHEDQAERAVHAALDAVAAVQGVTVDGGQALQSRVGIATGQVVIGDIVGDAATELGAVVGETPNLAARLQTLADPGAVIIGDATRRLAGHVFELEDEGEQRLKGFADPMRAWRVVGKSAVESRFEAAHGAALTQLVGREQEIALLLDRWAQAKDGEGQVVLLSGEAGIGKSRILRELWERIDEDPHTSLRYQCSPYQVNSAFNPIVEQLQHAAGFRQEDTAEDKLDKLERFLAATTDESAEAAPLTAALLSLPAERYPPLDMTPQRQKLQTIGVLVAQIETLAERRPVVMLVEDVHWIDPSTLETFDAIVDRAQTLAVLVVMTHRPEFERRWSGHGHVTHVSLNRLSRGDGKAMAERVTGGKALPEEVLTRILEQTDGVPLFVEELTKTVLEAGFLKEMDGRYVLTGPLPPLAIPATLHDSLMARLDRLALVKEVVQAAACIGREFAPELLNAVVSMDRAALDGALEQLVEAQLVFRRSTVEGASYIFKHALVQDAAYESLLVSNRQRLHAKLAHALEESEEPDLLVLARHYSAAGLAEQAAASYLAAGRRLLGASALTEASGALELGLRQAESLDPSARRDRLELDLRVALGTARMARMGWAHSSVAEALEPAFALAGRLNDREALGPVLWGLWVHYQTRTEFPRALEWLAELDKAVGNTEVSELSAVRDMSSGCQYFWQAEYDRASQYTDHIRSTYDEAKHARIVAFTNHDPLCFSLHWAGTFLDWIIGYPDRSLERIEEAVSLARRLNHPFNLAFTLTAGSMGLLLRGESERILVHCDEVDRLAAEEGLGPFAQNVLAYQWRGKAQILNGECASGYGLMKQGNDFWNTAGGGICNALFWSWMCRGLGGMGETTQALELIDRAIAHCRQTGDCYMEPECLRIKGELLLGGGEPDYIAAEAVLRESVQVAQAHKAKSWELRAATSLAGLWQSQGKEAKARDVLAPVYDWFAEGFDSRDLREAKDLLEQLA
jgi:class 3 adenylate cyclase/predicted ATPase/ABC-type transport system involved in cytochrome c biogenesis ATPase subunit